MGNITNLRVHRPKFKERRMADDLDFILKASKDHPIPLMTAPWRFGARQNGFYLADVQPVTVNIWGGFETYASIAAMLKNWVVDYEGVAAAKHAELET